MTTVLTTNGYNTMTAEAMGALVPDTYKQLGMIVTQYVRKVYDTDEVVHVGNLNEAILQHGSGRYVAVEIYKGLAIMQDIKDLAILDMLDAFEPGEEGEALRIDQTIVLSQEELGEVANGDA